MPYIFYNTTTNTTVGNLMKSPYTVDGNPGILPSNLIQLLIVNNPPPTVTGSYTLQASQSIDLSSSTLTNGWQIVPITDLTKLKTYASNLVINQFNTTISGGIIPQGITSSLACKDSDRNDFTQLITLLQAYENTLPTSSWSMFEQSPITIADINGNPIQLNVAQYRGIIISYGFQYNTIWQNYTTTMSIINNATTSSQFSYLLN